MSEGYVYICRREKSASGLVKIGHTDNLDRRVAEFNRETGADSKMILEVAFACVAELRHSLERAAHRLGRKHRARGEWFRLSLDEAIETVRAAAAELGIKAAICYRKDQPQEVTDHIRRQSDQEFAEQCRQRAETALQAEAAKVAARVDAHITAAKQAKARLDEHCLTVPTFRISGHHEKLIERTKADAWTIAATTARKNAEANVSATIKYFPYLIAVVGTFIWMSFLDLRYAETSFILTGIAILGSFFYAIGAFARSVKVIELQNKARESVCRDNLPEVEAMRASCLEQAKAASVAAWSGRSDGLTAAYQKAIERLDAVTLDKIKFDTRRALDGLDSKIAHSQKTLLTKPYVVIVKILHKAYGSNSTVRSHKDIVDLLIASHASEFNHYMEKISPATYDLCGTHISGFDASHPASGFTDAHAKATIARLTTGNRNTAEAIALEDALSVYRNMIANLQEFVVMKGLETQATIDHWRELFPNYTPLYRDLGRKTHLGSGLNSEGRRFERELVVTCHGLALESPIISPLASISHLGMNLVKCGETATVTQALLNFARQNVPNFITVTGEKKPIWVVDKLPPARIVKYVNVYTVTLANGGTSQEFYNRDQAKRHADAQKDRWITRNPGLPANQSPVMTNEYLPHERVFIQPPVSVVDKNVLIIPENGVHHTITFNEESEDGLAILASLRNCKNGVVQLHRTTLACPEFCVTGV